MGSNYNDFFQGQTNGGLMYWPNHSMETWLSKQKYSNDPVIVEWWKVSVCWPDVFRLKVKKPSLVTVFYIENDAEIFPAHYTWKVAEKGFKMAFIMNKLALIISFKIILEKYK
jgi:hypothetical protein